MDLHRASYHCNTICAYCNTPIGSVCPWSNRLSVDIHPITLLPANFHLRCWEQIERGHWTNIQGHLIRTNPPHEAESE